MLAPPPPSSFGTPASTRPDDFRRRKVVGDEVILVGRFGGALREDRTELARDVDSACAALRWRC